MGITLNLTADDIKKAQGGSFEPLPKGTYGAVIYEAEYGLSKNSGNPMYTVNYKIIAGPEGIGRRIKAWHVLQGPGSFSSRNLLKALGMPYPDKDTPAGEFEFPDADELVGKELNVKVDQESYQGINNDTGEEETRWNNRIAGTFPYDADKHSDPEDEEGSGSTRSFL